jgi:hypothetical protein
VFKARPIGRAPCGDCYDYTAAVLFNHHAAELWRRFTIYLPRRLAALAGITLAELRSEARVRYVKVAEYQARGVVHFHAIIRLDADNSADDTYRPPPAHRYTAAMLTEAITQAAAAVQLTTGEPGHPDARLLAFGAQTDTRPIRHGTRNALTAQAVANYIAKYATKTAEVPGLPDRPIRRGTDISHLRCPAHVKQMITAAWRMGTRHADHAARTWPVPNHPGPHAIATYLTKSRRYSVTFGQLRRARRPPTPPALARR